MTFMIDFFLQHSLSVLIAQENRQREILYSTEDVLSDEFKQQLLSESVKVDISPRVNTAGNVAFGSKYILQNRKEVQSYHHHP